MKTSYANKGKVVMFKYNGKVWRQAAKEYYTGNVYDNPYTQGTWKHASYRAGFWHYHKPKSTLQLVLEL